MKKAWSIRRNEEAVSPVIATILMVAITVVLAAVLYVMVLGFGGGGTTTPTASYSRTVTDNIVTVKISAVGDEVAWGAVTVQVYIGVTYWEWEPVTTALSGGDPVTWNGGLVTVGTMAISCNVTDVSGNGFASGSDLMTFWCEDWTAGTYTAVLQFDDTGESMGEGITFTMS